MVPVSTGGGIFSGGGDMGGVTEWSEVGVMGGKGASGTGGGSSSILSPVWKNHI